MSHEDAPALTAAQLRDALVFRVYRADEDLRQLADSLGINLQKLAKLAIDPKVACTLRGLRELAESQSQLILSRCRMTAAAKLVELAGQSEDGELARKASVDLLKLELLPRSNTPVEPTSAASKPRVSQTKILEALERMGRDESD